MKDYTSSLVGTGQHEVDVPVRWIGFDILNKYVVGYGLDNGKQELRWLRDVCYVE